LDKEKSTQFMLKLVGDIGTALAAGSVLVGDQCGLFKAMAGVGPVSADALARRAAIAPRYVEEWLAVMAGAGYVEHDADADTFVLPDEHAMFLTDESSEYYLGGLFQGLPGLLAITPRLVSAFKSGEGVSFSEFGAGLPQALEAMNRSVYENRLVRAGCLRCRGGGAPAGRRAGPRRGLRHRRGSDHPGESLPDRDHRRARSRRAFDRHRARHARDAGVADRVDFLAEPVEALPTEPGWDFISTFDVIHDLPDPLGAMTRIRSALNEGGTYLMVEPKVADRWTRTSRTRSRACSTASAACTACPNRWLRAGRGWAPVGVKGARSEWPNKPASRDSSALRSAAR
jgi:hypothetical protein